MLVLSCFAGAARQMHSARLVNPSDLTEVAEALHWALEMSLPERREHHAALLDVLHREDGVHWRQTSLKRLTGPRTP